MQSPVIILGAGDVRLGGEALREPEGAGIAAIEALLASKPRAAVVTEGGMPGFFRASVAIERGVPRVIVPRGALGASWLADLASRAATFDAELYEHDDARGYTRVRPSGRRVAVGAPDPEAWAFAAGDAAGDAARAAVIGLAVDEAWEAAAERAEPLPVDREIEGLPGHLEEIAFRNGDKPVLYLVVGAGEVEAVRARYAGAAVVERAAPVAVERSTGRRAYGDEGEASAHLFISDNLAQAERAAALWAEDSTRNVVALGALMGYPGCCTAAFAALGERGNNASLVYVTAARSRALGAPFHAALNVAVRRVVPFTPCSFGCARAIAWAERVLAGLPAERASALVRALGRPVLYLDEARAVVFEGARVAGEEITDYERAFFLPTGGSPEEAMRARRVLGALLAGGGRLVCGGDAFEVCGAAGTRRILRCAPQLGVMLPFGS
ncbi:hypothetical protein [Polyangium aurulentum]|uniref:hypothetical protein n=1 Tax=Polyangium aurulentum TaxID=2567896 RepID=UPI0010AE79A4|nr:hypothetical protein [Polyangium aurulentum]UQA60199.1 hypothetical protein E8A73_006885 [Polyangium aurulentum]